MNRLIESGAQEVKERFQKIILDQIFAATSRHFGDLKAAIDIHRKIFLLLLGALVCVGFVFFLAWQLVGTGIESTWGHWILVPLYFLLSLVAWVCFFLFLCIKRLEQNLLRLKDVAIKITSETIDGMLQALLKESDVLAGKVTTLPRVQEIVRMVLDSGLLPAITQFCEKNIPFGGKLLANTLGAMIRKTEGVLVKKTDGPEFEPEGNATPDEEVKISELDVVSLESPDEMSGFSENFVSKYRLVYRGAVSKMNGAIDTAMRTAAFKVRLPFVILLYAVAAMVAILGGVVAAIF